MPACRVHWQLPGLELHYVNIVEVTAPGLDMTFLDTKVRPYLQHSFSGGERQRGQQGGGGWPSRR